MSGANRIVAGVHPVRELLRAGHRVTGIRLADRSQSDAVHEIRQLAADLGVPVHDTDRRTLDDLTAGLVHQGVVAEAGAFPLVDLDHVLARARQSDRRGLLVAFDEVTDPHNIGSVARTAEALGAHGLLLPKHRTGSITATVEKAAAGALAHLPVVQITNLARTLTTCTDQGWWTVGLEADAGVQVHDCPLLTENVVLVVGSEGAGLRELTRKRVDMLIELPLRGRVGSYNASVAAAMALYGIDRARAQASQ